VLKGVESAAIVGAGVEGLGRWLIGKCSQVPRLTRRMRNANKVGRGCVFHPISGATFPPWITI